MEDIKVLIDKEKLNKRVKEIADEISNKYKNEEIILICILKGAVYFATDLSKNIKNDKLKLDFMKVKSYCNDSKESSGKIQLNLDVSLDIKDKTVIIVEDIIDSGLTLSYLYDYLKQKNPKTLELCALLDKKERRKIDIKVDYIGFEIEDKFVVGYGLDYNEEYRTLPYVGYIE